MLQLANEAGQVDRWATYLHVLQPSLDFGANFRGRFLQACAAFFVAEQSALALAAMFGTRLRPPNQGASGLVVRLNPLSNTIRTETS